jgi:hypothetical protein
MKIFKTVILLFLSVVSFGQNNPTPVNNWKSYAVPTNKDSLVLYNSSAESWTVMTQGGEVMVIAGNNLSVKEELPFAVKPQKEEEHLLKGKRTVVEVEDGFLAGFYRGEFGGSLFWFSKDGTQHYRISNDRIRQFKVRGGKLYAIEGLAHLGGSHGSIIELKKDSLQWKSFPYLSLPSAPFLFELDNRNNFVVVTSSSLVSIDGEKKIKTLVTKAIWDAGLYPNSLVIHKDEVFIGMRKGVYRYNLLTKKDKWLLPE